MDVSENDIDSISTTSQFITYLIDALTERETAANGLTEHAPPPLPLNSNIFDIIGNQNRTNFSRRRPIIPLFSRRNQFEELLRNSLYQDKNIKKVLSQKGSEQLKVVKFVPDKHEMKECVITQEKFEKDEEVICLPCKHIFNKEAIKTWLKEESSKCPICRYELDFVEKKEDLPETAGIPPSNIRLRNNQTQPINDISYNRMFNNMRFLYNPTASFTRRPRRTRRSFINNIVDIENQYVYDRNLQNAILNSVMESNSEITDDNTSEDVLDDLSSDIIENDIADSDVYLNMMENDLVLEDVDDDENFFND